MKSTYKLGGDWLLLMELQQMQINLNSGRIMQVKSQSGLVVVELFFCSNSHLLQPNEFLTNSFKEQQTQALEDYIETSVMLQYNKRH